MRLGPTVGDELQKTRPAVVVSLDVLGRLELRIVVPITAWQDAFQEQPWMARLVPDRHNGLTKLSAADTFQVRNVSVERFERALGRLGDAQMRSIAAGVALCVGWRPA